MYTSFLVLIVVLMLSLSINGLSNAHLSSVSDANAQVLNQKPQILMNANSQLGLGLNGFAYTSTCAPGTTPVTGIDLKQV
jgi:hypothetical protein